LHRSFPNDAVANVKLFPLVLAKKKNIIDCGSKICRYFYGLNVIVPVFLQSEKPLHLFSCSCSKLKLVLCALACCIGTTTAIAAIIAIAAKAAIITNVEFILSSLEIPSLHYIYFKKNNTELSL
jgi:hypothetical protein